MIGYAADDPTGASGTVRQSERVNRRLAPFTVAG